MKQLILPLLGMLILLFFMAEPKISLHPFKISLPSIGVAIGWILIAVGIGFLKADAQQKANAKGYEQATTDFINALNKAADNEKKK